MGHPPRIPVWLRWEQRVIYFVTICVAKREPVLANERAFRAFKAAVAKLQHWNVLAVVLMPDHLHVIVSPRDARDARLGNFSAALKRSIRQELSAAWNWQPVCFDRLLRSDESLHQKWVYVQDNPVRARLVQRAVDWPYRIGLGDYFSPDGIGLRNTWQAGALALQRRLPNMQL
jgi:putative transposase